MTRWLRKMKLSTVVTISSGVLTDGIFNIVLGARAAGALEVTQV